MNEQIKQILDTPEFERLRDWASIGPVQKATLESFAELIVRECAQVCRDQPNIYALKADRDNCAIAIEQHFGVEV